MLLVDMGNSRLKWAWLKDGVLQRVTSVAYQNDLAACLDKHWADLSPPTVALLSVANKAMTQQLVTWCQNHWRQTPQQYHATATALGVSNAYANPAQLGIDRWAAIIAAHHDYVGPICVVDAGTAITLDVVDAQGQHQGGLILPGAVAFGQSLYGTTARVMSWETSDFDEFMQPPQTLLGTTTRECVAAGTWQSIAGGIERTTRQLTQQTQTQMRYILTGGAAPILAPLLGAQWQQAPDLVLRGLALLADKQQRHTS